METQFAPLAVDRLVLAYHARYFGKALSAAPQLTVERMIRKPRGEPVRCGVYMPPSGPEFLAVPVGAYTVQLFTDPIGIKVDPRMIVVGQRQSRCLGLAVFCQEGSGQQTGQRECRQRRCRYRAP